MNALPSLRIACCQFSVEADIRLNLAAVLAQIEEAAEQGARVVHFSETALSGYAGVDIPDTATIDWPLLREAMLEVIEAARRRRVWVLLGSTHPLTGDRLPHNSVYVISDAGEIVERYDKRFCTGALEPRPELDLRYYTPGDHATLFDVDGYRCAVLICYDYRFPELYRDLKRRGAQVVFQSFHNARRDRHEHETGNVWKEIVPATMMCHAATNFFWVSANNSTAQYSSWPSFLVQPNGLIAATAAEHQPQVLIGEVDSSQSFWDASGPWRDRSIDGVLHSGELVDDPRSADRARL